MFNETSFNFGDLGAMQIMPATSDGTSGDPLWTQLGFGTRKLWKQAGKPKSISGGGQSGGAVAGDPIVIGTPGDDSSTSGTSGSTSGTGTGGGPGDFFSSIPPTYLLIGAAVILLVVLKK